MTEDCRLGLGETASKYSGSQTIEKIERAYENIRDTGFDGQDDYVLDIGVDDFAGI